MRRRDLVRILLHKSAQDEAAMVRLLSDPGLDDEVVGFHAQQAVEKALKPWSDAACARPKGVER